MDEEEILKKARDIWLAVGVKFKEEGELTNREIKELLARSVREDLSSEEISIISILFCNCDDFFREYEDDEKAYIKRDMMFR